MSHGIDRRKFLKIIGIGGATAALTSCAKGPTDKLIPYLVAPEDIVPGVSTWYATVCRECPAGCGMLVRTREGRAVKVEGNPSHPINRGRLCARGQSSIQGLYNPDRIRQPLRRTGSNTFEPITWDEAGKLLGEKLGAIKSAGVSDRIAFITPLVTGSLDQLIQEWMAAFGGGRRLAYEPFAYEPIRAANRLVFGIDSIPEYRAGEAEVLMSFGADLLETWISNVEYAAAFGEMHTLRNGKIGKFIHVEPRMSLTGANADQWVAIKPGTEALLAAAMIHAIIEEGLTSTGVSRADIEQIKSWASPYTPETAASLTDVSAGRIRDLARTFAKASPGLAIGGGVAVTGQNATATAAAINLLNYVCGNVGRTIRFGPNASLAKVNTFAEAAEMARAMKAGNFDAVFIYDTNPAFNLPPSADFVASLKKVPFVVSFSSYQDETAAHAHLVLPVNTPLECWGDYEPRAGIRGLMQPAMQPVFDTKALGDLLLSLIAQADQVPEGQSVSANFHDYVQERWKEIHQRVAPEQEFRLFWEQALRRGGLWEQPPASAVQLKREAISSLPSLAPSTDGGGTNELHLMMYPSSHYFDGRGANRPWLQEIPDPMTKIVWDSWAEMHPKTAERMGLAEGDVIAIKSAQGQIELPVHRYQHIRPEVVAVPIGQGHTHFGRYAEGRGANPINLLASSAEKFSGGLAWFSTKVQITRTGRTSSLITTEGSSTQAGRGIAQIVPLQEALLVKHDENTEAPAPDFYPEHEHKDHRWGMAIDLQSCIGCNACVAACYAENNIAIVGKEQMALRREMSWLRIERYFEGSDDQPDTRFIPMLCQQCDNAPCEPVCPVYATTHSGEGLNEMVYNRCVGTRYCSNNCPYKVREFNFFDYQWAEPLNWQLNPDVTVRTKGVMEKCTFCVQRIAEGKDRAKDEGRAVRDGEVTPACVQTCPTQAIVFGDLKDAKSRVTAMSENPRRYKVLEVLNTKPAITYLKKIRQDAEGWTNNR